MRGDVKEPDDLFSYRRLDERVAQDHPLRAIRDLVEAVRAQLHREFEARLYRNRAGTGAKLCFMGHALLENRNGLIVDAVLTPADGQSERVAALAMIEPFADKLRATTLGTDKPYDTQDFVNELRSTRVTPHVAQNAASGRASAVDGRTTRHNGFAQSIRVRKRIEEAFG